MSTRRALLMVFGGALALLATALLLGHWVLHGPVGAGRLAGSVTSASDRASSAECRRLPARRTWRCDALDDKTSEGFPYFVLVDRHSSCWRAWVDERSVGDDSAVLSGCVHLLEAQR